MVRSFAGNARPSLRAHVGSRSPRERLDDGSRRLLERLEQWRAVATVPLAWAVRLSDRRELIRADVDQWLAVLGAADGVRGLHSLLYAFPEFRSLYYYRLSSGNASGALAARLMRHLWRPVATLSLLTPDIGSGLFLAHGHSITLHAESIGLNCYIHQGVTVGWDYDGDRKPVIGDGVFIGAGAAVLGPVTIGDGARVGANAVVLCDVPAGATAVGIPARIVLRPVPAADGAGEAAM